MESDGWIDAHGCCIYILHDLQDLPTVLLSSRWKHCLLRSPWGKLLFHLGCFYSINFKLIGSNWALKMNALFMFHRMDRKSLVPCRLVVRNTGGAGRWSRAPRHALVVCYVRSPNIGLNNLFAGWLGYSATWAHRSNEGPWFWASISFLLDQTRVPGVSQKKKKKARVPGMKGTNHLHPCLPPHVTIQKNASSWSF